MADLAGNAAAAVNAAVSQGTVDTAITGMPASPSPLEAASNATSALSAPSPMTSAGLADSAAAAASAAAPMDSVFSWGGYFQAVAVLFLLVGLLWCAVWAMRRFGKFNFIPQPGAFPREALRMEAQLPLGPRRGLVVVRFLNRRLLLGVTEQHITYLTEAGIHDEHDTTDFQDVMEAAQRRKDDA